MPIKGPNIKLMRPIMILPPHLQVHHLPLTHEWPISFHKWAIYPFKWPSPDDPVHGQNHDSINGQDYNQGSGPGHGPSLSCGSKDPPLFRRPILSAHPLLPWLTLPLKLRPIWLAQNLIKKTPMIGRFWTLGQRVCYHHAGANVIYRH